MAVLVSTASDLYSIAFELPADIDRMIESENNDINMAVLSNRRQYTLLCESLMKGLVKALWLVTVIVHLMHGGSLEPSYYVMIVIMCNECYHIKLMCYITSGVSDPWCI